MKNGFIMAKAKEQTMAEMYDGGNVYLALTLGAAVTGIAAAGLGSVGAAVIPAAYLMAGGAAWKRAYLMRQGARKRFESIVSRVGEMGGTGSENYAAACRDLSSGVRLGGFYFGRKYIFSPYGILARWEEITAAYMRSYYPEYSRYAVFEKSPYSRIEVCVKLADGRRLTAVIRQPGVIRELNENADRFSGIFREVCGITVVKSFE